MVDRDEWFTVYASGPAPSDSAETSPAKQGSPSGPAVGFRIDPEAIPAVRAAFEAAIEEMMSARTAMHQMQKQAGGSVNPVVDKFLAALAEVGYGEQGSAVTAAESAIAEYQNVIEQLDLIAAGYQNQEEAIEDHLRRLRP